MSNPPTSLPSPNAISSPALADGPSPLQQQVGQLIARFGPVLAPANRFPLPERVGRLLILDIFGHHGFA
jgi:hypothetical protein